MLSIWQGSSCFNGVERVNAECRRVHGRCSARSVACRVQRARCMLHARIRSLTGPAPVVPLKFCRAHDGGKAEDALRLRARGLPRRRARHALRVARCAGSRCTALLHAARAHDARRVAPRKAAIGRQSDHRQSVSTDVGRAGSGSGAGASSIWNAYRWNACASACTPAAIAAAVRTSAVLGVFYYTAQGRGQLRALRVL